MRSMFLFSLCWILASTTSYAEEKPRVLVLTVGASDSKLAAMGESISEQVLTELSESHRFETMGASDLASVLGLERQKQVLGCAEQSANCMAEMSAALGAPWLVAGKLTRAGASTRLDLKLIRASDGKAFWRGGREFTEDSKMFAAVRELMPGLMEALGPAPTSSAVSVAPVVVGAIGLVGALAGGGLALITWLDQKQYADPSYRWPEGRSLVQVQMQQDQANRQIVAGLVTASVGVAALVAGLVWWATAKPSAPKLSVIVGPNTAAVVVGGSF